MRAPRTASGLSCALLALLLVPPLRAEEPPASATTPAPSSDAALRGLLGGARATIDPALAELEALQAELSKHPLAATAGKPGLDRARSELGALRGLLEQHADADRIARRKQRVWAALSLADRQIARAELAAALADAQARRAQADVRLAEARRAREQVEAELEAAGGQVAAVAPE